MVMIRTIVMCYSFFILLSILSRVLRISATVVKITINNPITEISNPMLSLDKKVIIVSIFTFC